MHSLFTVRRCIALLLTATPWLAAAAPTDDDIAHTVRPGDTLEHLARTYLGNARHWPLLQSHNRVPDPLRLVPGSVLYIPLHLQPRETATVAFVQGAVTGTTAQDAPRALRAGQPLPEGTQLQVGPESFVTVRLADGSLVRVQAQSEATLHQLRRVGRAGSIRAVIDLQRGGVDSTVAPRTEPARSFEVRTPRAVTSVRGTDFTVALDEAGRTAAAVTAGSVAVQSRAAPAANAIRAVPLQPGQGVAVAADGRVGTATVLLPAPDLSSLPDVAEDAALLTWSLPALPGAQAYQVQLTHGAAATDVLRNGRFATPAVRFAQVEDGAYTLAVRGIDAHGIPGQTATRHITVKTQPVPPLTQQPAPGGTIARTGGLLQCTPVDGVQAYRIQIAGAEGFASPQRDTGRIATCQWEARDLPAGRYQWRAASIRVLPNGQDDQGPFGAPQPFVLAERPAGVDLSRVQAGAAASGGVQLHWSGEPGQRFRLQVARDLAFTPLAVDTTLDTPAWTSTTLAPGDYKFRLQVLDPSGLSSAFSAARELRMPAPVQSGTGLPVTSADGQPLARP